MQMKWLIRNNKFILPGIKNSVNCTVRLVKKSLLTFFLQWLLKLSQTSLLQQSGIAQDEFTVKKLAIYIFGICELILLCCPLSSNCLLLPAVILTCFPIHFIMLLSIPMTFISPPREQVMVKKKML